GEISRQIREERACFAASDTLKFYFPHYSPFSDGNFILLDILEIMATQSDLLSSLVKGFPKGIKINKSISVSPNLLDNFHNLIIKASDNSGYKYLDIINELKIIKKDAYTTIKIALNRSSILLSAESCTEETKAAKEMLLEIEKMILELDNSFKKI
ncbi:MAG: hypothetical protein ACFFA6_04475, partial [Promethearchaeota archaeon]